jgi:tetratricopeptide (TPR) repeat protein
MKSNLEYIDDYFAELLPESEREVFNNRIKTDIEFAKEVKLYLQARKLSHHEKKKQFFELDKSLKKRSSLSVIKGVSSWVAAASVLVFGIWAFFFNHIQSPQEYAQNYISENLVILDTQMATQKDPTSNAVELFNQKKYQEALNQLEGISSPVALEYRGLCYLQLGKYQQAVDAFKQLAENEEILQNKGLFYQAIVLIKMEKLNEAKSILDKIQTNPTFFGQKEAEELRKLMK